MRIETTSLNEMLDHVEANVKAVHHGKTIKVERQLQVDQLIVDPKLFEQVLTNLIENACKYGGNTPVIKVTTRQEAKQINLTITDNGPGIGKEHLPRIFERFYRVDASRDRETGGTGLGLAIVKHIVVKHHGTIHAESDGACGTSFVINLNT
jgi:two-component system phosphate regulon sensor histidine kinase PhoR